VGNAKDPAPEVVRLAKLGVGAERGQERLLEAVLRIDGTDAADEEAPHVVGVIVHEGLEGRQHDAYSTRRALRM
jgi:hypothetical protein